MKFNARKNMFNKRDGGGVPWIVTMANAGVEYSVCGAASEAEAINLRDRFEACLPGAPVPAPTSVIELIRDFIGNIEESERRWNADYIASGVLAICGSAPVPAPRLECPTNHTYKVPHSDQSGDVWTYSHYRHHTPFCPDCGISLAPPVGTQE